MIVDILTPQIAFFSGIVARHPGYIGAVQDYGWKETLCHLEGSIWTLEDLEEAPDSMYAVLTALPTTNGLIPKRKDVFIFPEVEAFVEQFFGIYDELPDVLPPYHLFDQPGFPFPNGIPKAIACWYAGKDMLLGVQDGDLTLLERLTNTLDL